jgi:hypothetical protein
MGSSQSLTHIMLPVLTIRFRNDGDEPRAHWKPLLTLKSLRGLALGLIQLIQNTLHVFQITMVAGGLSQTPTSIFGQGSLRNTREANGILSK